MTTRYLLFDSDYEGDSFIREIEEKDLISAASDGDKIYVIADGQPVYTLHIDYIHTPIEGQGQHLTRVWRRGDDAPVAVIDESDEYRYGEPVPVGYCKAFDGYKERIMTDAEAEAIRAAVNEAYRAGLNTITYPNGATGRLVIATGLAW